MQKFRIYLILALTAVAGNVWAQMPNGEYLEGRGSKSAVILAHGQGLDPDSQVVGPLRKAVNRELGFHTLSLQMPVLPGRIGPELFQQYASTFPEAYQRIQAAIDFLRKEKGVERVYLMGYSMGGRMTSAFLANNPDAGVVGFIGVGLWAGGTEPLNTNLNLRKVKIPVIDIYAESDQDLKFAEFRKPFVSDRFKQVPIPGAKHDYRGYDKQIADIVIGWLREQEPK
ncbi:dienelactone hydrolase family protein [Caldimonas manganoxidans]|uniref:dienelactone hydrolase family protein n=1 Tax=Caldimonas manganoxidans TaxID=196015 RepID=UPI0003607488|nr:alpha/beta family hydrolase [Caldimonas manganoxidans]